MKRDLCEWKKEYWGKIFNKIENCERDHDIIDNKVWLLYEKKAYRDETTGVGIFASEKEIKRRLLLASLDMIWGNNEYIIFPYIGIESEIDIHNYYWLIHDKYDMPSVYTIEWHIADLNEEIE